MKTSISRGMSAAILATGLLLVGATAQADEDQLRAQCQAEATAAGIQDPAAVNQYIEDCMQAQSNGESSGDEQPADGEQTPST
jgi:uncharacterized protein involved in outer membrane biogenesis